MSDPIIKFNSSTGSDTAASGAGPATALTGTGAALATSTAVDLSADAPDLSGVAVDGSACLWVATSSGKQYAKITAVDNTTKIVTVALAYGVTEGSRTWAIGGKRATLDHANSRTLGSDVGNGWVIELETNQSLTSTAWTVAAPTDVGSGFVIRSSVANTLRTVDQAGSASVFAHTSASLSPVSYYDLKLTCSNGTKTNAIGISTAGSPTSPTVLPITAVRCQFGDAANKLARFVGRTAGAGHSFVLLKCWMAYLTTATSDANAGFTLIGCRISNCEAGGIALTSGRMGVLIECLVVGNTGPGIVLANTAVAFPKILSCTIHGNTGDGIDLSAAPALVMVRNCIITGNGGYGIKGASGQTNRNLLNFNNFGTGSTANTSGARLHVEAGDNDLAVDPQFADAAGGDFGVGLNMMAAGQGGAIGLSETVSHLDMGAAQRLEDYPAAGDVREGESFGNGAYEGSLIGGGGGGGYAMNLGGG